jgi:hypothetical protein
MPLAPSPLFQPEGADERAWGDLGGDWSRARQGFRRSGAARVQCRVAASVPIAVGKEGGCSQGSPSLQPASAPPLMLPCLGSIPTSTPAAPPSGVHSSGSSLAPSESLLRSASPSS